MKKISVLALLISCSSLSFAADHAYCPTYSVCNKDAENGNNKSVAPGEPNEDALTYTIQMGLEKQATRDMRLQCTVSGSDMTYPPIRAKVHCTNKALVCGIDGAGNDGSVTKINCTNTGSNSYHFKVDEVDCSTQASSGIYTIIDHEGCDWEATGDNNSACRVSDTVQVNGIVRTNCKTT